MHKCCIVQLELPLCFITEPSTPTWFFCHQQTNGNRFFWSSSQYSSTSLIFCSMHFYCIQLKLFPIQADSTDCFDGQGRLSDLCMEPVARPNWSSTTSRGNGAKVNKQQEYSWFPLEGTAGSQHSESEGLRIDRCSSLSHTYCSCGNLPFMIEFKKPPWTLKQNPSVQIPLFFQPLFQLAYYE